MIQMSIGSHERNLNQPIWLKMAELTFAESVDQSLSRVDFLTLNSKWHCTCGGKFYDIKIHLCWPWEGWKVVKDACNF